MKARKFLAALGAAALLAAPAAAEEKKPEENKVEMVGEAVFSENSTESFLRPNIFYGFGGLKAYTFFEFYRNDEFYGKTMVSRNVWNGLGPAGELVLGSDTRNRIGFGAKYSLPLPERAALSFKFFPAWFNVDGYDQNRIIFGYSGSLEFPRSFDLTAFGEFNIADADGPEWGYGEISVGRNFGKMRLSYNPLLKKRKEGALKPRVEQAFCVGYKF